MTSQEDRDRFDLDALLASIQSHEGADGQYMRDVYDMAVSLASTDIPGGKFKLPKMTYLGLPPPPWGVCQIEIEQETEAWRRGVQKDRTRNSLVRA